MAANYADVRRISEELEYAKAIMRRVHCKIINVSNRAIEETAGIILDYVRKKQRQKHIKNKPPRFLAGGVYFRALGVKFKKIFLSRTLRLNRLRAACR